MGKLNRLMLLLVIVTLFSGCSAKMVYISANTTEDGEKYSFYPNGSSEHDEYYFADW